MISLDAYRRRWEERHVYTSTTDWLKSVYSRWLRRMPLPMPGRGHVCSISLRVEPHPFYFRLGSTDLLVLEEIFMRGEYDMVHTALPAPPRVIVDLGANVGYSVRLWLKLWPEARIIAVEPEPENHGLCAKNCRAATLGGKVRLVEGCVRGRLGDSFLDRGAESWACQVADEPGPHRVQVKSYTLDQILELGGIAADIDLLKCDIEGSEKELFANSGPWISRIRAAIIELHSPYRVADLLSDLAGSGAAPERCETYKDDTLVLLMGMKQQPRPTPILRN